MTNLALALRRNSAASLAAATGHHGWLVSVSGQAHPGGQWNISVDPEAAAGCSTHRGGPLSGWVLNEG